MLREYAQELVGAPEEVRGCCCRCGPAAAAGLLLRPAAAPWCHALLPRPSTQRPAPSTQRPAPSTQRPAPSAQHPAPSTQRPAPSARTFLHPPAPPPPPQLRETVPGWDNAAAIRQRQRMEARAAVEEDMMTRVPLSKVRW
jgi:hypothetical protein